MNSVSEYDNGLDDLDYNWDNKSSNSDDSISYEAPPVKKLKTATKAIVKEKALSKLLKVKTKKVAENPPFQVQPKLKNKTVPEVQKVKTSSKVQLVSETLKSNDESTGNEKKFQNTGETSFPLDQFDLTESTVKHLNDRGIESLFPIQAQTYWPIRQGKDLIGRARTGQGKTLAFCLPILEQLIASKIDTKLYGATPRVLIMSPTRELARQIVDEFKTIGISLKLRIEAIYGGTSLQANYTLFKDGIDVVVGTPGRIKDLLDKKWLSFLAVKHVVLDEADQMLSMGFQEEIQSIFAALKPSNDDAEGDDIAPQSRQVLLFSATMPKWVHNLANEYLSRDRTIVDLVSGTTVAATTTIQHIAIPAHWTVLGSVINDLISMHAGKQGKVMVFSCSKLDCDTIAVDKSIKHECRVLHGDIPQAKRESTLAAFKAGDFRVLVCTDVAARGLDLSVELVIQSKPPCKPNGKTDVETYVHRSGRTGRAGKTGICITLYTFKNRYAMEEIQNELKLLLQWRGAPQPTETIKSAASLCAEELQTGVDPNVYSYFVDAAKELIETMGAEKALCAALAKISGFTEKPQSRSLLGCSDGLITLQFLSGKDIPCATYIFGVLSKHFSSDVSASVVGLKISKDRTSACFDIPCKHMPLVETVIEDIEGFQWLQICTELPPFLEDTTKFNKFGASSNTFGPQGGRDGGAGSGFSGGRGRGAPSSFSGRGGSGGRGGRGGRDGGGRGDYWAGRGREGGRGRGGDGGGGGRGRGGDGGRGDFKRKREN